MTVVSNGPAVQSGTGTGGFGRQTDLRPDRQPGRILHVTEAPMGGVIAYLQEMLPAQLGMGYAVTVVTPEVNREALRAAETAGARLVTCPVERGSVGGLVRLARLVLREARSMRPDVLHIHSTIAGGLVRPLRPFLPRSTRVAYCAHGWAFLREGSEGRNRFIAGVERGLAGLTDGIICISDHEHEEALRFGLPPNKLTVIENGVSAGPLAARAREPEADAVARPRIIAFAGRFDRQKGFDTFVDVLRALGPEEAHGIAIGRAIVSEETSQPLPENLDILGWQPRERVYELYQEADLLLVPSRWEGFGLVAVEAMQAGLPVFASRIGGLAGIVQDGETGRLFPPEDVAEIVRLIRGTTAEELRRFGEAGRRRYAERYTAQSMNDRVAAFYAALTGPGARPKS